MEMRGVDKRERRKYLKQADDACTFSTIARAEPQDAKLHCRSQQDDDKRASQARPQLTVQLTRHHARHR